MNIVNSSRCGKCGKVKNTSELDQNPQGLGLICADKDDCLKRLNARVAIDANELHEQLENSPTTRAIPL